MSRQYDAIIVGGGHNGLVCGAYLARAGVKVCVLERRSMAGGAAVTEEVWPGYRVSTASYVMGLMQPKVILDLELQKYGFEVIPAAPITFPLADGAPPLALAGSAGHSFARTLLDAQGRRGVPHYLEKVPRGRSVAQIVDAGVPVRFLGHPLVDSVPEPSSDAAGAAAHQQADRKAAQADFPFAQYELGSIYSEGRANQRQDLPEAYYWATLAARHQFQPAKELADTLRPQLTHDERARIDGRIKKWKRVVS